MASTADTNSRPKILAVDDDELILRMLKKALETAQYQVFATADPLQALQWLDETAFDAAILDVKLPKISGLKLLERIKAQDETVPVIILTGAEDERFETAISALRLGAHDFLMKPMRNIQDLLSSVERALEKRRMASSLKQLAQGIEQMNTTDLLTGLSNRRSFFDWLSHESLRTQRYMRPITCLVIGIDRFDELRRERGPQCADYIVAELARLLTRTFRGTDKLGRYGGSEFIVALPETEKSTAMAAAEKVRRAIESNKFQFGGKQVAVTASIGVSHKKTFTSVGSLAGLAMSALEKAQHAGGNSIRLEMDESDAKKSGKAN